MEIKKYLTEESLIGYSVCLFGFFPLLPEKIKGLPVILLIFFSLFFYFNRDDKKIKFSSLIKLSSLYLINLLSVLYSGSFYFPIHKMETTLALLIIPIAFSLIDVNNLKEATKIKLFNYFIFSTTLLSFISIVYYYLNNLFSADFFKVNSFRNLILDAPVFGAHPIYISLFLGISILLAITNFKDKSKNEKIYLVTTCFINIFHMLLLSSKGVVISLILSLILFVFLELKKRKYKIIISFGILGLFFTSILLFPNMERRFREFGKKTTYTDLQITNSSSIRIAIYECVVNIIKERPVLGYGWGAGDKALYVCYKEKSNYLFEKKYNTHNQYLGYYLDGGIIALFILLTFLYIQFKRSIYKKEYFLSSLILFYSFLMLTENILNRQSGVIVFIFFLSLFSFYKSNSKQID